MTLHDIIFEISIEYEEEFIRTENDSPWVRIYVFDKLALEMTMQDYFTEEVNPLILRELFLTAHKAGQESTKGKIR